MTEKEAEDILALNKNLIIALDQSTGEVYLEGLLTIKDLQAVLKLLECE